MRTMTVALLVCLTACGGLIADPPVEAEDIAVDLLSDQTSCHVPYDGGYCPAGVSFEAMRDFLAASLAPRFEVATARNGSDALTQLRDGRFDLVLSDVQMPGSGGLELLVSQDTDAGFVLLVEGGVGF